MSNNNPPPSRQPNPNVVEAADRLQAARQARIRPPKFKPNPDDECQIGMEYGDDDAILKLLDTFAVCDLDAANLLNRQLALLSTSQVQNGELEQANGAVALVHELQPRDAAESMLCTQMVGTQMLAMECLKRANLAEQTFEGRELNMRHAERFLRIFTQQLDALNKHRGKGQQRVTVEHVTVNEGGQAIVGTLTRKDNFAKKHQKMPTTSLGTK